MSKVRLKTLKELVDEFGDDLYFGEAENEARIFLKGRMHSVPTNMIGKTYVNCTVFATPVGDWAIKKPDKKKLSAYIDQDSGRVFWMPEETSIIKYSGKSPPKFAPEFDLYFDGEGE